MGRFEETRTDITNLNLRRVSKTTLIQSIPVSRAKQLNVKKKSKSTTNIIIALLVVITIMLVLVMQLLLSK